MRRGILASRDELKALREKTSHAPFDAIYSRLRKRCSLILESSPVTEQQWVGMWEQGRWASALGAARTAQGRIWDLLIAHHVDSNRAFRDRAVEELQYLIKWKTWTDPCHDHMPVDLCTAEAAVAAAVALDWLWEDLKQADRLRVLQAIRNKAIEPYHQAVEQKAWWYSSCTNWNAVINAGCGLAGLTLGDEEPRAEEAFLLARKGLGNFFAAMGREGGWEEGTGYWGYALRYILLFGEAASRVADDQRIFHARGMDATGLFPVYFAPNGQVASFGDNPTMPLYGALYLLVKHFGQKELAWWLDTYSFHHDVNTTDPAAAGLALLFRPADAEFGGTPALAAVKVFHQIGWAAMADRWPRPSLYVAAKTGTMAAGHSHRDMNSIQVQVDGEMLLTDLGNPRHGRDYASAARGELYEIQARGHNTLTLGDRDPLIDAQGRINDARSDGSFRWVACDAGTACGENATFVRHVVMVLDPRTRQGRMVVVLDELTSGVPEVAALYWHTTGSIELDAHRNSGMIRGHAAALNFALASTVPLDVKTESHEFSPGRVDHALKLSAGAIDKVLFASVFSRESITGKVQFHRGSRGLDVDVGKMRLSFKARKHGLEFDCLTTR